MMFKPGDILECLVDNPHLAKIKKGELAVVIDQNGGTVEFRNHPNGTFAWLSSPRYFRHHDTDLENK